MKTITFYSYKGGVGRTLLLANMAKQLSDMGKKVCIIDFDLEAPGIEYKLHEDGFFMQGNNSYGLVDYIYDFIQSNIKQEIFKPIRFHNFKRNSKEIYVFSAGNTKDKNYWDKLTKINWSDFLYKENSEGLPFLIDIKESIIQNYNPDYILIDSRTGITEIASITLSVFADEITLITSNNNESIDGTVQILNAVTNLNNNLFGKLPEVHLILSRIPNPEKINEREKEILLIKNKILYINRELKKLGSNHRVETISVIHSDRDIEWEESLKIEMGKVIDSSISKDYNNIFHKLFNVDFKEEDIDKYNKIAEAEKLIEKTRSIKKNIGSNNEIIISMLNEAITYDNTNYEAFHLLGEIYLFQNKYDKAIEYLNKAIELFAYNKLSFYYLGWCFYKQNNFKEAIHNFDRVINHLDGDTETDIISSIIKIKCKEKIEQSLDAENEYKILIHRFPNSPQVYNSFADYLRQKKQYKLALDYINKCLELDSEYSYGYATLAEIYISMEQEQDFFRNFELALKFKFDSINMFEAETIDLYKKYFHSERFILLLNKYEQKNSLKKIRAEYNINIEKIIGNI